MKQKIASENKFIGIQLKILLTFANLFHAWLEIMLNKK